MHTSLSELAPNTLYASQMPIFNLMTKTVTKVVLTMTTKFYILLQKICLRFQHNPKACPEPVGTA